MPRRTQVSPFTEISILFQEGIIKKIFYERRAYESVDKENLSGVMSRKMTKKRICSIKCYIKSWNKNLAIILHVNMYAYNIYIHCIYACVYV